ncbi:MAG: hypothetical protein LBR68_06910 [Lachnoclostridium sp.]|jgi:hypothetical protein|nr:hypothetical protein [Lachnoclostridium sp.]
MIKCVKKKKFNKSKTIHFTEGKDQDLFFGIQHASLKVSGKKKSEKWDLDATVSDTYDFGDARLADNISFANAANELGTMMERTKLIIPYSWSVKFSKKF